MECPIDNTVMRKVDKQGVAVDFCPNCSGVWLERGELDKMITLAADDSVVLSGFFDFG